MKTKMLATLLLALAMIISACGGGNSAGGNSGEESSGSSQSLVFGTGGTSGSYYPIGGALKPVLEQSDLVGNITVESTGASVANIQNIQDGLNQMAVVMSDVAFDAVEGKGQFEGKKVDIKALAGMYPNVVQIVATKDSGIKTVEDLKGKKVGVGKVGSGVEQSAQKVLEAVNYTYDDMSKVTHTGYADSVQEMKNGNLDAAFFTSGVPNSNITDLMQQNDITFVEIKGETAEALKEKYPFYKDYKIPAGDEAKYNLENEIVTVGIQNMIIVSPDLDEELVKDMTKRYYEYLGSDEVAVGVLKQLDRDEIAKDLITPLHPGAKAFYEEQGILE